MGKRPDPDEKFSLHPLEGEEVLRQLLGGDNDQDDAPDEGDDS